MIIDLKKISLFILTLFLLLFISNSNVFAIGDSTLFTHTNEDTSLMELFFPACNMIVFF